MTPTTEKPPPKPPRGLHRRVRREWIKLVEDLEKRGIDPHSRVRELEMMIALAGEEFDLSCEWSDANLSQRLAIGRRFQAITNQKIKILRLIFQDYSSFSSANGKESASGRE
jgi:hypothetical protein